ncbi:unnamed protein product [Sphacelaria rigidula]
MLVSRNQCLQSEFQLQKQTPNTDCCVGHSTESSATMRDTTRRCRRKQELWELQKDPYPTFLLCQKCQPQELECFHWLHFPTTYSTEKERAEQRTDLKSHLQSRSNQSLLQQQRNDLMKIHVDSSLSLQDCYSQPTCWTRLSLGHRHPYLPRSHQYRITVDT